MKKVSIIIGLICFVSLWGFSGASDLIYSTFLGGNGPEYYDDIAIDNTGNAYIVGYTNSWDFPTSPGGFDTTFNGGELGDIFVSKLNPTGSTLVYSTFLGGSDSDLCWSLALDTNGNAYITGYTRSTDFPTTFGAFDPTHNGDFDCFVSKIDNLGSGLVYSTYYGGSTSDFGYDIAVDTAGNAYITGRTASSDLPTTLGALDTTFGAFAPWDGDGFVCKMNATGTALVYSTFLGGSGSDSGEGIAVDDSGNAYITGGTGSPDFPIVFGSFDTTSNGGGDAFVSKLNATGSAMIYSTYLGGDLSDGGTDITIDTAGFTYITGYTESTDFPTTSGVFDTTYNGSGIYYYGDIFVSKLNPAGSVLNYSTYLGGSDDDMVKAIDVDIVGNVYIIGYTLSSTDFPTSLGAYDTSFNGNWDCIVSKFNPTGVLLYSTFLGGSEQDWGEGIAVDNTGNAYVTGMTASPDFPTTVDAYDTDNNSWGGDIFVTKLSTVVALGNVFYSDINLNTVVDAGDTLTMQFNRRMQVNSATASDLYLPVTGDSLGAGALVSINPVNDTQVVITLGTSPTLTIPSAFSGGATTPGSPSGIDISASMTPNAIEDIYGNDAQDGGSPGVDDSGQDIRYTLSVATAFVSTFSGATIQVSTDTVNYYYTKHKMVIPTGSILSSATITLGPPGDNHGQLSAIGLSPVNITFSVQTPATLVLEYKDADTKRDSGYIEQAMRIHQWKDATTGWVMIPETYGVQSVDTVTQTISVKIDKFNMVGAAGGSFQSLFLEDSAINNASISLPTVGAKTSMVASTQGFSEEAVSNSVTISVSTLAVYTKHRLTLTNYTTAGAGVTVILDQVRDIKVLENWSNFIGGRNYAIMQIETVGEITTQAVLVMEYKDNDTTFKLNDVIGGEETQLRIFKWRDDLSSWEKVSEPQTVNPTANTVSALLEGLSTTQIYAVGVDPSVIPIPKLNSYGSFSTSGDTTHWMFEKYGGVASAGTLSWVTGYAGRSGVVQMSQNAGEKAQLTQVFSVPSSGWYTASARVATDISDSTKRQKVYLYLQELSSSTAVVATGNIIIQPGRGGFGGAGNWQELKISFYSNATFMGVQVVGINQLSTSISGNLYIDDVWVVAGASLPSGTVTLTNPDFTVDTSGWGLEVYGGAASGSGTWSWDGSNVGGHIGVLSGYQSAGQKGQLTQNVDLPYGSDDALCSVWVYSSAGAMGDTQKVYLYLYSLNSSGGMIVVSGNAILQPGGWAQGVWRELQFGYPPLTGYSSVQLVGINRPLKPTQYIYFDTVSVKQD